MSDADYTPGHEPRSTAAIVLTTFVFRLRNVINVLLSRKEIHRKKHNTSAATTHKLRSDHFMRLLQYVRYSFVGFAGLTA